MRADLSAAIQLAAPGRGGAIGAALALGFSLGDNFRYPYGAIARLTLGIIYAANGPYYPYYGYGYGYNYNYSYGAAADNRLANDPGAAEQPQLAARGGAV